MNNIASYNNSNNNSSSNNITDNTIISCKYCGSELVYRYGNYKGIQKYKCKSCKKVFSNNSNKQDKRYNMDKYSLDKRKMAITMYINNVGIRSMERILGVSNVLFNKNNDGNENENNRYNNKSDNLNYNTLYKPNQKPISKTKIKNQVQTKKPKINILEMDELYSYVKKTKQNQNMDCY